MSPVSLRHSLTAWWCAFRAPAQINLALPLLVGLRHGAPGLAWSELPWLKALTISLLLQAMILFSNEASDADSDDPGARTPISGGAGVGAAGDLSPRALRQAAQVAGGLGLAFALWAGDTTLAALWLAATGLVWAYDGHTLRLSRHPAGALVQAVGVGGLTPLIGAALVAPATAFSILSPQVALTGFCLGLAGHLLTSIPDRAADAKVGKRTLAVALGDPPALWLMLGLYALSAVLLIDGPGGVVTLAACVVAGACAGRRRWRELDAALWLVMPIALMLWLVWVAR